jgi:lipoprotein signal peptidase
VKNRTAQAFTILAGLIALLDAALKAYAIKRLPSTGSRDRFIDFILHKNPGIAFDIPVPFWIIGPLTVAVCTWLVWTAYKHWNTQKEVSTAANIVIIGALGNLIDRFVNGFTTDYIIIFSRSVINLSDVLIVAGIIALLWYTRDRKTS